MACASSHAGRNAPSPVLTSSSKQSGPSASFLDMMDDTIRGSEGAVPVASRSAYSALSTGAMVSVGPLMATPMSRSCCMNCADVSAVLTPGSDSSLSRVPPVWPRPRPLIIGTITPKDATRGANASET